MADARITQAALLVLARGVPCLTRWAQCWKITTVKPRFREQAEQEFEFSNAFLHPWVDPIDLKTPPLNPLNTHLYDVVTIIATGWTDVISKISRLQESDWRTGFS